MKNTKKILWLRLGFEVFRNLKFDPKTPKRNFRKIWNLEFTKKNIYILIYFLFKKRILQM